MVFEERWLVFISAFLANLIMMGVIFSMGTLLSDIMDTFNVSRSDAALVQSVNIAVSLCFGVFHGGLLHKFGVRNVTLCLSCIISISFGISFFATSITFIVISIGIFGSFPASGIFIATSSVAGRHFYGKQGLFVVSIVNVGSGVGGVIFPYVLNYLTDSFGLRGTYLITGGIFLNIIPLTLLWKPPITMKSRPLANLKEFTGVENKADKVSSGELDKLQTNKGDVIATEFKKKKHSLLQKAKLLQAKEKNICFLQQ